MTATSRRTRSRTRPGRGGPIALIGLTVGLVTALMTGCSGSSTDATPPLSPQATQGRDVATARGCASCHSSDGEPGLGPTWKGRWGQTVTFKDGRTATFDAAYVRRSILDPDADQVAGTRAAMPKVNLSDDEIAAVTSYIEALSPRTDGTSSPSGSTAGPG